MRVCFYVRKALSHAPMMAETRLLLNYVSLNLPPWPQYHGKAVS